MFTLTRGRRFAIYVVVFALLAPVLPPFAAPVLAKTYTVCPSGCNFTTIAAALAGAKDGDSIQISAGTYAGGFNINKDIDLFGAGSGQTTIQGTNLASVIHVLRGSTVSIEDVTITGGGGSAFGGRLVGGGGILNEGALTLADSVVRNNAVTQGATFPSQLVGGGIASSTSKQLRIFNTEISGNRAGFGGGVYINAGETLVSDSTISGNQTNNGGDGAGAFLSSSTKTVTLRRTTVRDNASTGSGGGVFASGTLVLTDSTIFGNTASISGGGLESDNQGLQITRTTISGNSVDPQRNQGLGGGLLVGAGGATIQDSTVENNRSAAGAGLATSLGDLTLKGTTVASNVAQRSGGGIFVGSANVVLNGSRVIDNTAGTQGGGIFVDDSMGSSVALRNGSTVSGNQPDQCFGVTCRVQSVAQKQKRR